MPVRFIADKKIFRLDTPHSTYLFRAGEGGYLIHLYYGATVSDDDLTYLPVTGGLGASFSPDSPTGHLSPDVAPFEYPTFGAGDFRPSALKIRGFDGNSVTDLRYESCSVSSGKPSLDGLPASYANSEDECETLTVVCRDALTNVRAELSYTAFSRLDVITRSVKLFNDSDRPVTVERAYSLCLDSPRSDYSMLTLSGTWARERHPDWRELTPGTQGISSRRGASGHHENPFMALSETRGEESGETIGFGFVYSGNFEISCDVDAFGASRTLVGLEPDDFAWKLGPGQSFETPEAVMVFSGEGLGRMSRTFHRFVRENICRGEWKLKRRPILVNNWEATYFGFDDEKLLAIARAAKDLGIEMLVMDDGWFGRRNDDRSSLGDWYVNENKLRGGLGSLVSRVNALGLKFGIWFEPEMISPVSGLYAAHPEWTLSAPGRDRSIARSQYVLDMSRADVRDYLFERISAILNSANIEYVKWDFNRNLTEVASLLLPADRQKETAHRYVLGLYELLERLRAAFPHILLEGCSGGGGRFDLGMLCFCPQIWTSDDTDPVERLDIQWGTLMVYPACAMSAHVSATPNGLTGRTASIRTRGAVAMGGAFGYELDLSGLSEDDRKAIAQQVRDFKSWYGVVEEGDYYRLVSPFDDRYRCAWEFVAPDRRSALFTFVALRSHVHWPALIRLKGLDPSARYRDGFDGREYRGDTLMHAGLRLRSDYRDFESEVHFFTAL